ncbi:MULTISPECIES: polysaccharide deacetylase family protein [unclassified Nostoc]|uniref:polysaccharide deacetylase family protein n=1 Tax=unclassified Nostoc TaxID=2593658 RepID=UPI0025AAD6DD|nr:MULTISPECIES: polysaccharide deacetylase family protein [unclassified Nostoc]MDM9585098.1 polysaccharide deacetylase family protein [Nostoc sp. GT001]MDZ7949138.1 polysaccharide deacetylase family protein [Nostoc sp. EfeVER01]MDZ7995535.1 polysaccharide deacetylase family protein [Nostoc sp. EspVER01]
MDDNKSFFGLQKILVTLLVLSGSVSVSTMMLIKSSSSNAQSTENINVNNQPSKVGIQQQIEELKATMLRSWQQQVQTKGFSYTVPQRFQGAIVDAAKLTPEQKVIALTFDDGPWPESTGQVLDILKKNQIKGTFFLIGQNVKNYPGLVKREIAEGHVIGNHTWHHWYQFLNPQAAAYEIDHTADLIYQVTGIKTNLFRPPGGIMHNGVASYARNSKYAIIRWSSDSVDYSRPAVPKLINNVFRRAKPGGIVLMHDGGGNRSKTVQALPEIIANFRKQGYKFVTIPELLEMQDKDQKLTANKKTVQN